MSLLKGRAVVAVRVRAVGDEDGVVAKAVDGIAQLIRCDIDRLVP